MPDGRTLIADDLEGRLFVIDWTTNRTSDVGRVGRGPGEYLDVSGLYPLGDDSSVVEDTNARSWLKMAGTRILGPLNAVTRYATDHKLVGVSQAAQYAELVPFHYGTSPIMRTPKIRDFADSLLVVLVTDGGRSRDTVERIGGSFAGVGTATKQVREGPLPFMFYAPFRSEEQALLYLDGWLAVARRDPYRVDWRSPTGEWTRGRPLPFDRVAVDAAQREAEMDRQWTGRSRALFTDKEMPGWPQVLPPFQPNALVSAPDGTLIVIRTPDARQAIRLHDVIDRRGALVRRLALPTNVRIVGFGARHVYTVERTEEELDVLQRRPWPQ